MLSATQIREIRRRRAAGETLTSLATAFGVSRRVIWKRSRRIRPIKRCVVCGNRVDATRIVVKASRRVCTLQCRVALDVERRGNNECWRWRGHVDRDGYGSFSFRVNGTKRYFRAHRLVLEWKIGKPLGHFESMHSCDNPPCCNPAHLMPGTTQQNQLESVARGRAITVRRNPSPKGEASPFAKLKDDDVRHMREQYEAGGVTCDQLAVQYGVSGVTAWKIVKRYKWKHVA